MRPEKLVFFKDIKHIYKKYVLMTALVDLLIDEYAYHPATRRRDNVVRMLLCVSQRRRTYVSNETPNDVSVERRQDVSVVRLHDVSNKSQMKYPRTCQ